MGSSAEISNNNTMMGFEVGSSGREGESRLYRTTFHSISTLYYIIQNTGKTKCVLFRSRGRKIPNSVTSNPLVVGGQCSDQPQSTCAISWCYG